MVAVAREVLHVRGSIATIDKLIEKTGEEHEATRGIAKVVGRVTRRRSSAAQRGRST